MNKYLSSSINPDKLSLTIRGIAVGVIPILVIVLGMAGFDIPESNWSDLTEAVISLATSVLGVVSSFMVVYGLIRKILVKFQRK